ncbi:MAG: pyridoxal-dependent decarboxylase, exosortase A system-associated [Chloroflexota bacterium]|nr:MAG: pyridoxal-dependent decarboxylase, exosortase A system-associated [Chloroflexota bacterium]
MTEADRMPEADPVTEASRVLEPAAVDLLGLAARYGTPAYIYDLDVVAARVAALWAALPAGWDLAYALKANPAPPVLERLAAAGLGADVASLGELRAALAAGFSSARIVVTGPGKRDVELEAAVEVAVRAVTVESAGELARLERIAAAADRRVPILLRLALGRVVAGGPGQFGMDADDLRAAARHAAASPRFELLGVHAFGATNVRQAELLAEHAAATLAFAREVMAEAALPLRLVDVGGGLGIPYAAGAAPLDLERLGRLLADLAAGWAAPDLAGTTILLEPGRFLTGPAGLYLTRVLDTKTVAGVDWAIVDGGIHHLLAPALLGRPHRLELVRSGPTGTPEPAPARQRAGSARTPARVRVAGPLCTGLDVLGELPVGARPTAGDLVAVRDAGAYGFSESMPLFLSHPTPAEVVLEAGRVRLSRASREPKAAARLRRLGRPGRAGPR